MQCSIDALLDRTIKHMLFLQSVTKYAEKVKQADQPKVNFITTINFFVFCISMNVIVLVHDLKIYAVHLSLDDWRREWSGVKR